MEVILLTLFLSLLLAVFFLLLFLRERRAQVAHLASPERDALLPLTEEGPPVRAGSVRRPSQPPPPKARPSP